ncbi:MAG: hypothetical protein ACLQU2_20610 [Candidatus Binataceae bacterium]
MSDEPSYGGAVRAWADEHHVSATAVERWLMLGEAGALALLSVAEDLRLRTGQLLNTLEMLGEISVREGQEAAAILARGEFRTALKGSGSRPERASAFIDKLRELRYPRLARLRTKLEAALTAMRLPHGLTVVLPKDLSSDEVMIRLTVRTPAELENLLDALRKRTEEIKALLEALGGSDEI